MYKASTQVAFYSIVCNRKHSWVEGAKQMVFVTYPIYNCPFPCVSTLRVQVEMIMKIMTKIRLILW